MSVPTSSLGPYTVAGALVVAACVLLAVLLLRTARRVRLTQALASNVAALKANQRGLLRARTAALKVALAERKRRRHPPTKVSH